MGGSGDSAGAEQPSARVRHEKGGGVGVGVGGELDDALGGAVRDAELLGEVEVLPESEIVPLAVTVGVWVGVAVGESVPDGVDEREALRDGVCVPVADEEQVGGTSIPSDMQTAAQGQGRQAERVAAPRAGLYVPTGQGVAFSEERGQ
jgi:hypothetical protein